jgi:hypothetical protein
VFGILCWRRLLVGFVDWWDGLLWWRLWVGVGLLVCLLEQRLLPLLLLAKDVDCLPKLFEPRPFSVNVLPPCFGPLGHCLSSSDGLLLLTKPLDLLLHSAWLLFYDSFVLSLPIFKLMLAKFLELLPDLNW